MFNLVLGWLGNLLGGPFITAALNAYKAKLAADGSAIKADDELATRELAVQQRELELQTQLRIAEIGKWYEPDHIMGYVACALLAKLVIYDTMLGLGTTPALHGWADQTLTLIVGAYFGKRAFENVARIIKR